MTVSSFYSTTTPLLMQASGMQNFPVSSGFVSTSTAIPFVPAITKSVAPSPQPFPHVTPASTGVVDEFAEKSHRAFMERYPVEYASLSTRPDFDPRYFTQNTEGIPLYAKGLSTHQLGQKKVIWNLYMWDNTLDSTRAAQRKHVARMSVVNANASAWR